jgi:N-methylhydantoinase A
MKRIGVDVGGTFTDIMYWDEDGGIAVHKVPSIPHDPSQATVDGVTARVERIGVSVADLGQFLHGTTVATNIVLEHNGVDVGLITTEGFRDILHIARKKRPCNYSSYQDLPWQKWQLVRRGNRRVVPERINAAGEVLIPLDEDAVREQVRVLKDNGVAAIAVCFLHAYRNPAHERAVKRIIERSTPACSSRSPARSPRSTASTNASPPRHSTRSSARRSRVTSTTSRTPRARRVCAATSG